jgi:Tol biopolymer transport system component
VFLLSSGGLRDLFDSTRTDVAAQYSPCGKKIPMNPTRLASSTASGSAIRTVQRRGVCSHRGGSSVARAGSALIAFDFDPKGKKRDIYLIGLNGGKFRRSTTDSAGYRYPSLSGDGEMGLPWIKIEDSGRRGMCWLRAGKLSR